jgi:hypothetical protein
MPTRGEKNLVTSDVLGYEVDDEVGFTNTIGYSTIGFYLQVPTGATVCFEGTFGGTYEAMNVRSTTRDVYLTRTNESGNFIASITSIKRMRARVIEAGTAPGRIDVVLDQAPTILEGIEYGWPPHRFGFEQVHKDFMATTQQTDTSIWTPVLGNRYVVTDLVIVASGTTNAIVSIYDDTDVLGNRIFRAPIEVVTNKQFEWSHSFKTPFTAPVADTSLKITTSAAIDVDISIHGYEIGG